MTKEHVVSESVLHVIHGPKIRNIVRSELFRDPLHDYEWTIRDVCGECNSGLSRLDEAGAELARYIETHESATSTVPFSRDVLHWLIKTQLNHLRIHADKETGEKPAVDPRIYRALRLGQDISERLYRLTVEGWLTRSSYWAPLGIGVLQYRWYALRSTSTGDRGHAAPVPVNVVISNFRLKWFNTFLLLPSDGDYRKFDIRAHRALQSWNRRRDSSLTMIDVKTALRAGQLPIRNHLNAERILDTYVEAAYEKAGGTRTRKTIRDEVMALLST